MKIWIIIVGILAIISIVFGVIFYTTIFPKMDSTEQKIVMFSDNKNKTRNLLLYNIFMKDNNESKATE